MANILLLDDNTAFLEPLLEVLSQAGHEVTATSSGLKAVAHVKLSPCDLMITDILMPGQDGIETICAMRKVSPALKIIAMSGGGMIDTELCLALARRLGADSVLKKPFSPADILTAVSVALGAGKGNTSTEPGSPMPPI
jgi:CheY-like chemotaxis protein